MIKFFTILFLLNILIFADTMSIDMQISRIKNAPAQDRVKLMNAFKRRVFQMNYEDRSSAIREMQVKIHAKTGKNMDNKREIIRQGIKEHISEMQTSNNEDISSYQNMNQQQIKNLIAHEKIERKEGRVSKLKIVNQILKIEKEQQESRIPSKQVIKELQKIKLPIKQIKELQNIEEQQKVISPNYKPEENKQITKPQEIKIPNNDIINQVSGSSTTEQNIEQSQQVVRP